MSSPSPSWDSPDLTLVGPPSAQTPKFPLQELGAFWSDWVSATADNQGCPPDFVATNLLAFAAALIGNARCVRSGSHVEPSIIWTTMVGQPSVNKTGAMQPFADIANLLDREITEGRAEAFWPLAAGDRSPQFRIADATAAAAAEIAAHSPRGMLLMRDELSGWLRKDSQRPLWLEAYNGRSHIENRKGRDAFRIDQLSISVIGSAQPDTLRALATSSTDVGATSRLLYAFPDPRRPSRSRSRPDAHASAALLALARLDRDPATGKPVTISLSRRGRERAEQWNDLLFDKQQEHSGMVASWLGKQRGVALRIALVLEHLWWSAECKEGEPFEVSARALMKAHRLIDSYFFPMMLKTLGVAEMPLEDRRAELLLRLLKRKKLTRFNARAIKRGGAGPLGALGAAGAFDEACRVLEEACLIRRTGTRAGGKAGRLSADFEVNPCIEGAA